MELSNQDTTCRCVPLHQLGRARRQGWAEGIAIGMILWAIVVGTARAVGWLL